MTPSVTVQRVIHAPAATIFELLATPDKHCLFDGSDTVRGVCAAGDQPARRVRLGDEFGMSMHWGFSYSTRNVVVEFVENQRIAWQTWAPAPADRFMTGRIWRYELSEVSGGTLVKETWDTSTEKSVTKPLLGLMREKTRANMVATLDRLETIATAVER